jgi:hypothetical protein
MKVRNHDARKYEEEWMELGDCIQILRVKIMIFVFGVGGGGW